MAADIFCGRVERHVDAVLEGAEQVGRPPGVIHDDLGAVTVRDGGDRRHVLHLEGQGARRLDIDDLCVGPHQLRNAVADQRIVISGLNTHAGQHPVAEIARRPISGIDHQEVVTLRQEALQRRGDRGEPGADDRGAVAALDLGQQFLEREGRRRARKAVAHDPKMRARVRPVFPLGDVFREDRRGVVDGRVDRAVLRLGIAPEMRQQRVLAVGARPVVVFHVGSNFLLFRPALWQPGHRAYRGASAGSGSASPAPRHPRRWTPARRSPDHAAGRYPAAPAWLWALRAREPREDPLNERDAPVGDERDGQTDKAERHDRAADQAKARHLGDDQRKPNDQAEAEDEQRLFGVAHYIMPSLRGAQTKQCPSRCTPCGRLLRFARNDPRFWGLPVALDAAYLALPLCVFLAALHRT